MPSQLFERVRRLISNKKTQVNSKQQEYNKNTKTVIYFDENGEPRLAYVPRHLYIVQLQSQLVDEATDKWMSLYSDT